MKIHCLFEQSGTFKNEFRKLGYEAYDYDILNEFGETDYQIDLYKEIEGGYNGEPSLFDRIDKNDLVMCFFPCIRFENQVMLWFRGDNYAQKDWTAEQNIQYDMKLMEELTHNYMLVNKLFLVCMRKGLKLVMENPYSEEHFLRRYWCIKPNIIDYDRRKRGDYYKKPTQYWFLNCEPKNNFIFEVTNYNGIGGKETVEYIHSEHYKKMGAKNQKVARSMIHPDYANRFIRQYLI